MSILKLLVFSSATCLGLLPARANVSAPGDTSAAAIALSSLPYDSGSVTTCGMNDDFSNGNGTVCADLPFAYPGPDTYYSITLGAGNSVTFSLTTPAGATGDLALFLVSTSTGACAGNSVDLMGTGPETITAHSYAPGTYYLLVDSFYASPDSGYCGPYTLSVTGTLGTFCGNGSVESGEDCDGGDCCSATCKFKTLGIECRSANGVCDLAETCTGSSAACPADSFDSTTVCRPANGDCDAPETCDGTGPDCPSDAFDSSTVCRPANGDCDVAESCNGTGPNCPTDTFDSSTVCRPANGACDVAESCNGTGPNCPSDVLQPAGTVCQASTLCQASGTCQGSNSCTAGSPANCDDGDPCTLDACDLSAGCTHAPICDAGVATADAGVPAVADASVDGTGDDAGDATNNSGRDAGVDPDASEVNDATVQDASNEASFGGIGGGSGQIGSGGSAASGGQVGSGGSSGSGGTHGQGGSSGGPGPGPVVLPGPGGPGPVGFGGDFMPGSGSGGVGATGTGGNQGGTSASGGAVATGGAAGMGGVRGTTGSNETGGAPGSSGSWDGGGTGGSTGNASTGGTGGLATAQDASSPSDGTGTLTIDSAGDSVSSGLQPDAGFESRLADASAVLIADARGVPSTDGASADAPTNTPNTTGCTCDVGRRNQQPGGYAFVALLFGALLIRGVRRRKP